MTDPTERLAKALDEMAYLNSDEIGMVSDYLAAHSFDKRDDFLRAFAEWLDVPRFGQFFKDQVPVYLASLAAKEDTDG